MFKTLESYRTPPGYGFPRCYFCELFNIPLVSVSWQVNHTMSCCHSCVPFHYPQKETQSLYLRYKAWLSHPAHILPNPRHIPFTEARLCSLQSPLPDLCTWWWSLCLEHFLPLTPLFQLGLWSNINLQAPLPLPPLFAFPFSFPLLYSSPTRRQAFLFFLIISIAPRILPGLEWEFNERSLKTMNEWNEIANTTPNTEVVCRLNEAMCVNHLAHGHNKIKKKEKKSWQRRKYQEGRELEVSPGTWSLRMWRGFWTVKSVSTVIPQTLQGLYHMNSRGKFWMLPSEELISCSGMLEPNHLFCFVFLL